LRNPYSNQLKKREDLLIKLDERGEITANTCEIQRNMMVYFKILYSNELENLEEIYKFLNQNLKMQI
jgi:hypothetical protein